MFESTKTDLRKLLETAASGALQLPDFQRNYVWNDDDVRSLLASIARGFPVGALLTLETGGVVNFKPRVLEGVEDKGVEPEALLLDGQQRITSLFQALFTPVPVSTRTAKGKEVDRHYYIDIKTAVEGEVHMEEAIIGVPEDRIVRRNFGRDVELDLSTPEKEYELDHFPLDKAFDSRDWFFGWRDFWKESGRDFYELERAFSRNVLDCIERYEMPIIRLDRNNSREAICLVFEKVNVGGKKLDAFELLTAIYAADEFDLRTDWYGLPDTVDVGRKRRIIGTPNPRDVLKDLASIEFLQACTLLHTRSLRLDKQAAGQGGRDLPQVSCRRDTLLALPLEAYQTHSDAVENGFVEAAGFLNEQKIIWHRDVPYPPVIVALAATFAIAGRDASTAAAKEKLSRWFWSVVLGELYGSTTESRLARDVPELVEWLAGGARPRSLDEAIFQQDRLRSLRSRQAAAYKGLHALMMRRGCRDFITDRPTDIMTFFNDRIDIHHVFPQAWCKTQGIEPGVFNAIVNKTPLSKASNIAIGGDAPSVYLKRIEDRQGIEPARLDEILRSHLIEPEHLRTDDFEAFFATRLAALTDVVAQAMDKPVAMEHGTDENERDVVSGEDDDLDAEEAA